MIEGNEKLPIFKIHYKLNLFILIEVIRI